MHIARPSITKRGMQTSPSARILIVGGDHDVPGDQGMAQLLGNAGYSVLPAADFDQAHACIRQRAPELTLIDLDMAGVDGIELCERLHRMPGLSELPVIFVTTARDRERLIAAFNAGAVDYITQPFIAEELLARVRTHLNLKRARDRLGAMLRERQDVTNVVAHDIKNPLSSILFAAQLLLQSKETPIPRSEVTRDIKTCSEEALRLIQRFLSREAEGQRLRQFMAQRLQLAELAHEAMQLQKAAAEARGIRLELMGDAVASADRIAARNVLQNLLSNAIRHSPEGEQIHIEIGAIKPGFSRCRVLDRGPGISEEGRSRLFQRYLQFAAARDTRASAAAGDAVDGFGNGLGLAIAKHDVSQMGGYLWYEPRPGGGSVFGFDLPQQPPVQESRGIYEG